ncbi:hypothetical protein MMC22_008527 [Lobaria immixta]|nr:hypothetical protein [Lobaria immixta]
MAARDRDILPNTVKPVNYDIFLYDLELGGEFRFQGMVKIEAEIKAPTAKITLNSIDIKIHSAEVFYNGALCQILPKFINYRRVNIQLAQKASEISFDVESQRVTLSFDAEVAVSKSAVIQLKYAGTMNSTMAGFYRSRYKPAVAPASSVPKQGDYHYMFSTQFESSDARRAFPCFDEPNLKATFDFSIEIPEDLVALSNMPEKTVGQVKNGLKVVSFGRTPLMSTYLVAWGFGDFEYVEDFTQRKYNGKQLPVRVYATRGLKEQGRLGLENAHQIIDYFSEIFGIDYPLPKKHGAMENWGLLTFRTAALLFDKETSDASLRNKVAYLVAHELAHQWFGNLVTMDWWNDLWLNEGFATWVGWLATHRFHPNHLVWSQFVAEWVQSAFQLDSLRSSHPIDVPVKDVLEVNQIFDAISYSKGSSVIRMLSNHLGNATTTDLWEALSKASGKDVNKFMDPWIRKIGFPVLTVAEEPGQIRVRQSRFLSTGDVKTDEDETIWWIPLGLKIDPPSTGVTSEALTVREEAIQGVNEKFYKLNADQFGFYRTNYPPERLAKLGASKDLLTVEDKIGLVGDVAELAIAGYATTASLLAFLENFRDEKHHAVWLRIISSLAKVRSIFATNDVLSAGLKLFTLKLVEPATEKIGWDFSPNDDYLTGQLRALLIRTAGSAEHRGTIEEAKRRFKEYATGNGEGIHPSLRLLVFELNVKEGGTPAYEAVKHEYANPKSIDGKQICLSALGRVQTADLVEDFLAFQFSDEVATQDIHTGSIALGANAKTRDTMWQWIKSNWDKVHEKLSDNSKIFDRYLKKSLENFASHEMERDITSFFEGKNTKGYDCGLAQVSDSVRANANYKERDEQLVLEWIKAHGYA